MNNKTLHIFLPDFTGGGAENMIVNFANYLDDKSIDIKLIVVNKKGPLLKRLNNNIEVHDLKAKRAIFSIYSLFLYCRKHKPYIMMSTLFQANIALSLVNLICQHPQKTFLRIENNTTQLINDKSLFSKFMRIAIIFFPFLFQRATKIICVSKNSENDLNKNYGIHNTTTIWNPALSQEKIDKSHETIQEKWWPTAKNVIISIGRLSEVKDHKTLIRAFANIDDKSSFLVILGEGEKRTELEEMCKELKLGDRVIIPGFVDNPYKFLRHSKLFILPSLYEGMSNALVEAISFDTTVIASNCDGGNSEVLNNGEYGVLFEVGNFIELTQLINEQLQNPKMVDSDLWIKNFGSETIYKKYLDVFFDSYK
ncbi:MAG: glycosyltransferase [Reichenbachiella sp.]